MYYSENFGRSQVKDKIEFCKYFVYNKIKEKRKKEFHMNKATREKIADDIIKAATAENVKMSKKYRNGILCVSADEPYELIPLFMIDKKQKKIIWQCEVSNIELNHKMVKAIVKIIEELEWE